LIELQSEKISTLQGELQTARASADAANTAVAQAVATGRFNPAIAGAYTVKAGDTLGEIATAMGTTVTALAQRNNLRPPYRLSIGQQIVGPAAPAAAAARVASAPQAAPSSPPAKVDQPQQEEKPKSPPPQRVAQNTTISGTPPGPQEDPNVQDRAIAEQRRRQPQSPQSPQNDLPQEVGVRPEDDNDDTFLAIFQDVGGILTPRGALFLEPAVDFTASSDNRFFFEGVEIIDAILIGAIEATDTDRIAITERVGLRYGVTSRFEIDGQLPYVYREDRVAGVAIDDLTQVDDARFGAGLGDVSFGARYQLNNGGKWPYVIANLRAKAPTGNGPFDVDRAPNGLETELATGSGFWTIEPSLSFLLPTDPAVIFGNIGYQANLSTSPDLLLSSSPTEEQRITEFKPGDAISASLGVGLSLNDRLSVNFGYDHRYFFRTQSVREITTVDPLLGITDVTTATLRQEPTTVGNFLFGGSYVVNDKLRLNLNTGFGATDEAPDFRVSLRAQIRLKD
ncbi:MAG: LysM peptidoglycan-binding domain-containing protein, partial [Pseudomonadota bacterium]